MTADVGINEESIFGPRTGNREVVRVCFYSPQGFRCGKCSIGVQYAKSAVVSHSVYIHDCFICILDKVQIESATGAHFVLCPVCNEQSLK